MNDTLHIRKSIELKSAQAASDGHSISGIGNVTGYLDSGGDIVQPGAFADTVASTVKDGFIADGHGWGYGDQLGYFTAAAETPDGFAFTASFHDTPDAQAAYQKAKARIDAGKSVFLSIGYSAPSVRYIDPTEYDKELPALLKAEYLQEGVNRAKSMPWGIWVLEKLQVHEVSLVGVAMNAQSMAQSIKSGSMPAGVTYSEEREAVLTALRAWVDRTESKCRLRLQDKGRLSADVKEQLKQDIDELIRLADRLIIPDDESAAQPGASGPVNIESALLAFEGSRLLTTLNS